VVVSTWTSMSDFTAWERGPNHRAVTAPLRPYQDPRHPPAIYNEVAAYGAAGPSPVAIRRDRGSLTAPTPSSAIVIEPAP
jgi:hypothetical protein